MSFFEKHRLSTTQMILSGFFFTILFGGLVLTLPISSQSRTFTPFVDALFASTTSVCVTGLTTVVTAEHWSLFGKLVILILIQFGGLGYVTFITSISLILHKRITLRDRLMIQEAYNLDTLRGLVKLTIRVLKGTFLVEGIGALIYCFQFVPEYGLAKGVWYSVFHSVSSFCNAGIDLIGSTSFVKYSSNPLICINTMALIIIGGIGYPVWWDFLEKFRESRKQSWSLRDTIRKLSLHTKLAVTVTACLIFTGAAFVFINEYSNPLTLGPLGTGSKILASFFQSVTLRTAGYFTIPQEGLKASTAFVGIILMFIGGSPSGTAGGIKTVSFAVLLLTVFSTMRSRQDIEVFERRIVDDYLKKALTVFLYSFTTLLLSTICLSLVVNRDLLDIMYECASALGTVGVSRNLTGSLPTAGKYIIIATMYLGRVGPISMALALKLGGHGSGKRQLPDAKIIVG